MMTQMDMAQMLDRNYRQTHWRESDYQHAVASIDSTTARWTEIRDDLARRVSLLEKRRKTRFEVDEMNDLKEDIEQCDKGLDPAMGVSDPRVRQMAGQLGLERLALVRGTLVEEHASRFSTPQQTRSSLFRYIGPPEKHDHDGRLLKPGEVVVLSEQQAEAFADRFEPEPEIPCPECGAITNQPASVA